MAEPSLVIGIGGGTGAGKTSVARAITAGVDSVTLLLLDDYYRDRSGVPTAEREGSNYDHPAAFDWPLLLDHPSEPSDGRAVEMPQYDFSVHDRTAETVHTVPGDVLVVEEILALHHDEIRDRFDVNLYVETDADVRIIRRIRRDVVERGRDLEGVIEQYLGTVKPMHERFVPPSKKRADLIMPEGANDTAVEVLRERVNAVVSGDGRPAIG